jgi:hypothetical protein
MASTLTRAQQVALKTWTPANLRALWAAARKANPSLPATPPMGFSPNVGGFGKFTPETDPPPGTYDPSIDAQVRAGQRGYGDLQQDTDIANQRGEDDFLLGSGELQKQLQRQLADAATSRTNQHADYETGIADLIRGYTRQGVSQAEHANAAGVVGTGGALQQALEKRTANLAHDRAPLDTNEQRRSLEYDLYTGPQGRYQQDYGEKLGQLGLSVSRPNEDRANALTRAGRENDQLGLDASAQRWFQATQGGYDPPARPASQQGSLTNPYKLVTTKRGTRRLYSTGYLTARR